VSTIQNDRSTHEGEDQYTNSLSDFLFHKLNQTCLAPLTFSLTITFNLGVPLRHQHIDVNVPFGCVCIIAACMAGKLTRHRDNAVVNSHSLSSLTQRTQWHRDTADETVDSFCKAIQFQLYHTNFQPKVIWHGPNFHTGDYPTILSESNGELTIEELRELDPLQYNLD
jgi:hypothetical protein